ncbi:hypothetical protein QCA50_004570 [Cerrena zonata]|uniref:Uncharacterized protein n=1 Tax=Cerrena zonata TaxID=2478898 RepID=A0AAW0GPE6_9APHY
MPPQNLQQVARANSNQPSEPEEGPEISDTESVVDLQRRISTLDLALQSQAATEADLREALKHSQLLNITLVNKLHERNEEIDRLKANQRQRGRGKASTVPALVQHEDDIKRKAKQFAVMHELWLDNEVFQKPRPGPMTVKDRYASEQARIQGITLQLYEFLPEHFHELLLRHKQFGKTFQQAASSGRASHLNTLRQALPTILDMPSQLFALGNTERSKSPALQALLKRDPNSNTYPTYPPILFPKDADGKMPKLFHSVPLMKALQVILFGASSLTNPGCAKRDTNGKIWGVTSVSSGAIAGVAILVRFILSPDEKFEAVGRKSGIKYAAQYTKYKELLDKGLTDPNNTQIRNLIVTWNRNVFAREHRTTSTAPPETDSEPDADDILLAMQETENIEDNMTRINDNGADINNDHIDDIYHDDDHNIDDMYTANPFNNRDVETEVIEPPAPHSIPRFAQSSALAQNTAGSSRRSIPPANPATPQPSPSLDPPRRSVCNQASVEDADNEDSEAPAPAKRGRGGRPTRTTAGRGRKR